MENPKTLDPIMATDAIAAEAMAGRVVSLSLVILFIVLNVS